MAKDTSTARRLRFEQLVREAEHLLEENPQRYKLHVIGLALLGYGVLFSVLALLIALIAGSVWGALVSTFFLLLLIKKKLIFPVALVAWVILRSLWVRFEPPRGFVATAQRFPALHQEVRTLRAKLSAPRVHEIIISTDFNAGVIRTPRLGVFGWPRNTVLLGLPLLLTLTPEQARAVLAHEFGHLSRDHARFGNWIYRLRQTWYRVMAAFDAAPGWYTHALKRFFDWYAPYFSAYTFALARSNEYQADAVAVAVTSAPAAAQALVTTHISSEVLHEGYWRPLLRRADLEAQPEARAFSGLAAYIKIATPPHDELLERIRKAVAVETGHADTHPALRDRLASINAPPSLPAPVMHSAAEAWLSAELTNVLEEFDREWSAHNREPWEARFRYVQDAKAQLADLKARAAEALIPQDRWNIAAWTEEFEHDVDALPLYRDYQTHAPDDRDADFAIGRLLLARRDAAGIAHLERAVERFELALPACEAAYAYFTSIGDKAQADAWRLRGERALDTAQGAYEERRRISIHDSFVAARISAFDQDGLCAQLAAFDQIAHIWIAQKELEHVTDRPMYVVAIELKRKFKKDGDALAAQLLEKIDLAGVDYVLALRGEWDGIAKKVQKVGVQLR